MSVSGTENLHKLDALLFARPAGRNIIYFAREEITRLRARVTQLEGDAVRLKAAWDAGYRQGTGNGTRANQLGGQHEKLRDALTELLSSCHAIDAAHGRQVIDPHAEAHAEAILAETAS